MMTNASTSVPTPDLAIAVCCIIGAAGGLIANAVLITVIASNKDLRSKDYIAFILTRAISDLLLSISYVTLQPIAILTTEFISIACRSAAFVELFLALISIYLELMLACNRYVALLKRDQYDRIYKKRNIIAICAFGGLVVGALSSAPHIFTNSLGRVTGGFCTIRFAMETLLVIVTVNYIFIVSNFGFMLYFNFTMYVYLKRYQQQPMTNNQRTQLQKDSEMLRYIFVVAFLPLLFQAPVVITSLVHMVHPVSGWAIFVSMAPFVVGFTASPVITLTMVRSIRRQLAKVLKKAFHGLKVVAPRVEPVE